MADHFYSVSLPGAGLVPPVVKGTSTASGNFELRVTDSVTGNTKEDVLKGLEAIIAFIVTDPSPSF